MRDVEQFGQALTTALAPVEIRVDPSSVENARQSAAKIAGSFDQAEDEAAQLEDQIRQVARFLGTSDDEAREFLRTLQLADREADEVARSTSRIAGGFGAIRSSIGGLFAGFGAFTALRGVTNLIGESRTAFATLQDSVNAVKVVFGEASGTVLGFADTVAQTAGLSMAQFNQAASTLGSSLINVGFGADEAARKTIDLTQRAADMASIFGGEVSAAVDAILSALRGEGNPIERFGVTLTAAKVQAEAAALGFKTVGGELDSTAKTAATLSIIMRETARTSGDFANTADDLANAQKAANAEFENAKAALGEALLPVFQAFLDIGPEVLQVIEDMVPSLVALADSAGRLATSTPGVLDFVDALHLLADLPRGFGQLLDIPQILIGSGAAAQRSIERVNTQGLIDDIREGEDAALAFANRLAAVGRAVPSVAFKPEFILGLRQIAGLDIRTTLQELDRLIQQGPQLGLTAPDIDALKLAFAQLRNELFPIGNEVAQAARAMGEELPDAVEEAITPLDEIKRAASEAGVAIGDFALSTDPAIAAMLETLDPADRLQLFLDGIGTSASAAADFLDARLRPALVDAGEALTDINDDGQTTVNEFISNLEEMALAALSFKADLATIFLISPELAASLLDLGPEAAAVIVRGLKADPQKILEAEAALLGDSAGIQDTIQGLVALAVGQLQAGPDQVEAFTAFVTTLDIPGAAEAVAEALNLALPSAFKLLNLPELDVSEAAVQGRETLIDGLTSRTNLSREASALTSSLNAVLNVSQAGLEPIDLNDATQAGVAQIRVRELTDGFNDIFEASIAGLGIDLNDPVQAGVDTIDATELTRGLDEVFDVAFLGLDLDLFGLGAEGRTTLFAGLSTQQSGEAAQVRGSILNVLDAAIERTSPPRLFSRAGEESRDAFWSAFDEAAAVPTIEIPELIIPPADFTDMGVSAAQTFTQGFTEEVQRFDDGYNPGDFGFVAPEAIQFDFDLQALQEQFGALAEITGVAGAEAREAFMVGLSTLSTEDITRLRASIMDTVNEAIEAGSPSRLFLRIGGDAGDSFWSGFNQSELALKTPTAGITGSISNATAATNVVEGGFTFAPTVINPTVQDLETTLARQGQLFGAVSGALGRVGRALPK